MNTESYRPQGYTGERGQYLSRLIKELKRMLIRAQRSFGHETLYLPSWKLEELASVAVEFAEDVHNDIGIWSSLERYNLEFFNTPLPLVLKPNEKMGEKAINKHRIHYLLWVLYPELNRQLILSPTHQDLNLLVTIVSDFLEERFGEIPRGSGIKTFLSQPNKFGWDVKRKLLWLGMHSYLFRNSFRNYVEDRGGKPEIPIIDDFVCQQTTAWSGLGVIDILAETLNISKKQRATLRSWYERHMAYYRILAVKGSRIEVLNVINDKPYVIRLPDDTDQFEVGQIIFGSLVPWNEEWYWSGKQMPFNNTTEDTLQQIKDSFLRKVPEMAYRYCDQLAEKAKERVNSQYQEFVKYHGDDLVIYPNGISMAADLQKKGQLQWESKPKEVIAKAMKEHNLQNPWPSMSLPREVLENENGIGMYYNPEEGQEIMTGFNDIISGLKKKGISLTEDEGNGIRSFICSESVSPSFVRRLVREYGYESIELAFLIRDSHEESHLDYLLRRYKGAYYRNRRPRIAFV